MENKISKEELLLNQIIDSCNQIIDNLSLGAIASESDFNSLGYIYGGITTLQNRISIDLDNQITQDVQNAKNNV